MTDRQLTPHQAPVDNVKALPVLPPGQIIGRNRELASMYAAIKAGTSIYLAGAPGVGKSALAAVLASGYIGSKRGGVIWLHVTEDDLILLTARIGRALGADTYAPSSAALPLITDKARSKIKQDHPLIVLEGLIDSDAAREFVRQVAADTPVILIDERPVPGRWTPFEVMSLNATDRAALFRYYAGQTEARTEEDITALVNVLGGLPLTLEIAARHTALEKLTPGELVAQLPSLPGFDPHEAIMALVFKRLSPPAQGVLLSLSASFTGGASLELLTALTRMPAPNALNLARSLAGRGLLREHLHYGQPYFRLHELSARYGRGVLRSYGHLAGMEKRMIQVLGEYVERHAKNTPADLDRLAAEIENITAVAASAVDIGEGEAAGRLVASLEVRVSGFVSERGFRPEVDQLKKLLTLLQPTAPVSPVKGTDTQEVAATILIPEPIEEDSQATPVIPLPAYEVPRVALEMTQPSHKAVETQPVTPVSLSEASPEEIMDAPPLPPTPPNFVPAHAERELVEDPSEADTERMMTPEETVITSVITEAIPEPPTMPEDTQRPTDHSLPTLQAQLQDARDDRDALREAAILHAMGKYYIEQGDLPQASETFTNALDRYQASEDEEGSVAVLEALTALNLQMGNYAAAVDYAQPGISAAAKLNDRTREGRLRLLMAEATAAKGGSAIDAYTQAVEALRRTEDWALIGGALAKLGSAYRDAGRESEAIMMFEQAAVIFHKEGMLAEETDVFMGIGDAHEDIRAWDKAQTAFERAVFLSRERFHRRSEALGLGALARVHYLQTNNAGAADHYRQALHLAYELEDVPLQVTFARELGRLLLDDTDTLSQAAALLREAVEKAPEDDTAKRLLHRAEQRLERIGAAGMTIPSSEESNRDFAAKGYLV